MRKRTRGIGLAHLAYRIRRIVSRALIRFHFKNISFLANSLAPCPSILCTQSRLQKEFVVLASDLFHVPIRPHPIYVHLSRPLIIIHANISSIDNTTITWQQFHIPSRSALFPPDLLLFSVFEILYIIMLTWLPQSFCYVRRSIPDVLIHSRRRSDTHLATGTSKHRAR